MKLMILGAGIMQLPLIKTARSMGHEVIVVGRKGKYPGISFASKCIFTDFTKTEEVVAIAEREQIDGIWTCGLDSAIRTMAAVSEALQLPGISTKCAEIVCNKLRMKDFFVRSHIRTADFVVCRNEEDGHKAFHHFNKRRVVFKAVDSQGSAGITMVENPEQVSRAYQEIRKFSNSKEYIVEEFLHGTEIGAQAFVVNSQMQWMVPHGDYIFQGGTGIPIGHYIPLDLPCKILADCNSQIERFVQASGIRTCALNVDFIICNQKAYVLEIAARCGATMIAESISLWFGYNYYEKMIEAALGLPISIVPGRDRYASATMTLTSKISGKITRQEVKPRFQSSNSIIHFDNQVGDQVHEFRRGIDRIGHVISRGKNLVEAEMELKQALESIILDIIP